MKSKIIWLRISYWGGAIADGLATLRMLNPKLAYGVEYRYDGFFVYLANA
jgi:hypothetical protein